MSDPGATVRDDRSGWLLAGLLFLALALRLVGIDRFPFEQDELYSVIEARYLFNSPLNPGIEARPLYYLLQHPLLDIFPVTHVALRILPLIFGILGVWATWKLGREIFGTMGAAVATLMVAIAPWHLHASGMARYWSLVYLLAALTCLFLLRALRTDQRGHHLAALASLVLGWQSHPTFLFPMVGIALATALVKDDGSFGWRWPTRRAWKFLWGPFLLIVVTGFLVLRLTGRSGAVRNWDGRGLAASLTLLPAIVEWMTPIIFAAGALGALLAIATGEGPTRRRWGIMAVTGTLSGLALLTAASLSTSVYADYAISILPLVFVSIGGLVVLGAERMRSGGTAMALTACLLLVASLLPSTVSHLSDGMRFDYRPALREAAAIDSTLPVLSLPIILQRHYAPELHGIELPDTRVALDEILDRDRDVWAVIPLRRNGIWQDPGGEIAAWVAERCRTVFSSERPRLDYRLYRTELVRCRAPESS